MFGERYNVKPKITIGVVLFIVIGVLAFALAVFVCYRYKKVKRLEDLGIEGGKYDKMNVGELGEGVDEDEDRINTMPSRDSTY